MNEPLVSKQTATLLREVGFNWGTRDYFAGGTGMTPLSLPFNHNRDLMKLSRPTLAHAAMWLREVHGIDLHAEADLDFKKWYTRVDLKGGGITRMSPFDTYDTAYEAGIVAAIKIVQQRKTEAI
jgi:hypothetical protein